MSLDPPQSNTGPPQSLIFTCLARPCFSVETLLVLPAGSAEGSQELAVLHWNCLCLSCVLNTAQHHSTIVLYQNTYGMFAAMDRTICPQSEQRAGSGQSQSSPHGPSPGCPPATILQILLSWCWCGGQAGVTCCHLNAFAELMAQSVCLHAPRLAHEKVFLTRSWVLAAHLSPPVSCALSVSETTMSD